MMVTAVTLNAQVFTEYFESATPGMNLEDYNDWYVSFKDGENLGLSPVIEGETLFYDGYIGSDIGYVAKLDSAIGYDSGNQRISTKVVTINGDTLKPIVGETMYAAFIVNIMEFSKHSFRDFFTWEASSGSSFQRGRVFAKVDGNNMDLTFAVSKNNSSSGGYVESELMMGAVGVYHLLVVAYEVIEGASNDVIHLYINPDPTLPAAEQTNVISSTDIQSDYTEGSSKIKINLRQRGINAQVGGIRVGTNWEEVLLGATVSATGVSLDNPTLALALPGTPTGTLVATVAPAEATDQSVSWSSSNEAVATVADGVVTAVAAGEATITATTNDGGFTADCAVTVTSTVGISDFNAKGYSLYPNPVSDGILYVKLSDTNKANNIEIYNTLGALVHSEKVDNRTNVAINTARKLNKGIYFVKINNNSGSHIEQIIVQ